MAATRKLTVEILGDAKGALGAFGQVNKGAAKLGEDFVNFGKKVAVGFAALTTGAVVIGRDLVNAASDLAENLSKTKVVFGDAADSVIAFSKTTATALGQSQNEALQAAGTFGIFGKAAGLTGQELSGFTTELITLASDMASFSNTTPQEAIEALGAALRGESEPIRKYGVMLNDAALKAKALEMGIYDGNGTLTSQQKILASSALIFEQTADAQGDFARTSDGLANQQRILAARVNDLKTRLGSALLPIALKVATAFGDLIDKVGPLAERLMPIFIDAIRGAVDRIRPLVTALRDALAPTIEKIGDWMKKNTDTVKVFFGVLAGAAAIAAIAAMAGALASLFNPITLIIGAIAAVAAGVYYAYQQFEGFREIVDQVARFFTETVIPALVDAWPKVKEAIATVVDYFKNTVIPALVDAWPKVKEALGAVVDFFQETVLPALSKGWDIITDAVSAFVNFFRERMDAIKAALVNIKEFMVGVLEFLQATWRMFGDNILNFMKARFDAMKTLISGILTTIKGIIDVFLGVLSGDWGRAWDGIKNVVKGIMETILGVIKTAVSPIVFTFGLIGEGIGRALSVLKGVITDALGSVRSTFVRIFNEIYNWVTGLFSRLGSTIYGAFRSVVNSIIGIINRVIGGVNTLIRGFNYLPGPDISTISRITPLATGGIVTGPTFALIGEAGPEAVIPLSGPNMPDFLREDNASSGDTIINIKVEAGLVSSPDQIGQQIIEAIRRAERRSGQVFAAA